MHTCTERHFILCQEDERWGRKIILYTSEWQYLLTRQWIAEDRGKKQGSSGERREGSWECSFTCCIHGILRMLQIIHAFRGGVLSYDHFTMTWEENIRWFKIHSKWFFFSAISRKFLNVFRSQLWQTHKLLYAPWLYKSWKKLCFLQKKAGAIANTAWNSPIGEHGLVQQNRQFLPACLLTFII